MIVCRKCSRRHPDGTEFCACGAFLEFDGEHVADPVEPTATQAPPAATSGMAGRSVLRVGTEPRRRSPNGAGSVVRAVRSRARGAHRLRQVSTPDSPTCRPGQSPPSRCGWNRRPGRATCRARIARRRTPRSDSSADTAETRSSRREPPPQRRPFGGRRGGVGSGAKRGAALERADLASMANSARRLSGGGVAGRTVAFRGGALAVVAFSLLAFLGPWRGTVFAGARKVLGGNRYSVIDDDVEVVAFPTSAILPAEFSQQGPENVRDHHRNTAWATRWLAPAEPGSVALPSDGTCLAQPSTDTALAFTFEEPTDVARIRILGGRYADDPSAGCSHGRWSSSWRSTGPVSISCSTMRESSRSTTSATVTFRR